MILYGQYDSPFVRRVGIALRLYNLPFAHRPLSAFADAQALASLTPLMRVPALQLADGTVLTDSQLILDYVDTLISPVRALVPRGEPARHRVLRRVGLATGLADKAVSLFYERALHAEPAQAWVQRCEGQIRQTLTVLEKDRGSFSSYWGSASLSHADIALACALRFLREVHEGLFIPEAYPALLRHSATCEALPVFQEISQSFRPPA